MNTPSMPISVGYTAFLPSKAYQLAHNALLPACFPWNQL